MNIHNMNVVVGWMILQAVIWFIFSCILCCILGYKKPSDSMQEQVKFCTIIAKAGSIITATIILAIKLIWFW